MNKTSYHFHVPIVFLGKPLFMIATTYHFHVLTLIHACPARG